MLREKLLYRNPLSKSDKGFKLCVGVHTEIHWRNCMKLQWSLILGLVFALITAIFAVINVDPVQVNLLFGHFSIPLILLILGCTLLGGIIVGSYSIYLQYKTQKKIKGLQDQLAHIQEATGYIMPEPSEELKNQPNDSLTEASTTEEGKN